MELGPTCTSITAFNVITAFNLVLGKTFQILTTVASAARETRSALPHDVQHPHQGARKLFGNTLNLRVHYDPSLSTVAEL